MATPVNSPEAAFYKECPGSSLAGTECWNKIREAVVLLQFPPGSSASHGSGFIAAFKTSGNSQPCLVTCKHVLETSQIAKTVKIFCNRMGQVVPSTGMAAEDLLDLDTYKDDTDLDYCVIALKGSAMEHVNSVCNIQVEPLSLCSPEWSKFYPVKGHMVKIFSYISDEKQAKTLKESSSTIRSLHGPLIAHMSDTKPGSSGAPLLFVDDDKSKILVCGLHLGNSLLPTNGCTNVGFNRALHIKDLFKHWEYSDRPDCTLSEAVRILAASEILNNATVYVRLNYIKGIMTDVDKNTITLDCEDAEGLSGSVVSVWIDGTTATVRFTNNQVTFLAVQQLKSRYDGSLVSVDLVEHPMDKLIRACSGQNEAIIISGIPKEEDFIESTLEAYLDFPVIDSKLKCSPDVEKISGNGDILVRMKRGCADCVTQALSNPETQPFEDIQHVYHTITATKLPHSDGICVKCTHCNWEVDKLKQYFNNTARSGGKGVKSVTIWSNKMLVICFQDYRIVDSVICKDHTKYLGDSVELYRFNSALVDFVPGLCKVEIKQCQIRNCQADALVNFLQKDVAIAQSLQGAGGQPFVDACRSIKNVLEWNVGVTEGGKLKCRVVIHAVVGKGPAVPEFEKKLIDLVKKALQECENRELTSVAIPPLAFGGAQNFSVCSKKIVHAVFSFISNNFQHLKLITLVVPPPSVRKSNENLEQLYSKELYRTVLD